MIVITRYFARRLVVLSALSAALLVACVDGGVVQFKTVSDPNEDGARTYSIRVEDVRVPHQRTTAPDDPWVRQCFDPATQFEGLPYYCSTERTVTQVWIGGLTAAASLVVTWLLTLLVVRTPPRAPAPIEAREAGASLFERAAAEKQAHRPVHRTVMHMAVTRYSLRAGAIALVVAFAGAIAAGIVGPGWIAEWVGAAGALHVAVYATWYAVWVIRGALSDEVRHARLAIAIGAGIGLFAASFALAPGG